MHLASTALDPTGGALFQYGALGVMATILIIAVRILFKRETDAHDLDRQRADRLEQELRAVNAELLALTTGTLTKAANVLEQVLEAMRSERESRR